MASLTWTRKWIYPAGFNKHVSFSILILIAPIEAAMRICGRDARAPRAGAVVGDHGGAKYKDTGVKKTTGEHQAGGQV
jgi:hypothetical protein